MKRTISVIVGAIALCGSATSNLCFPVYPLGCQDTGYEIQWADWRFSCFTQPTCCCEVKERSGQCFFHGQPWGSVYERQVVQANGGACGTDCVPF